jgi:hypothetical protein
VVRGECRSGHSSWTKTTDVAQANVMLAYPIPEAEELLESKFTAAQESLDNCEEDLDFLREQITVCSWCGSGHTDTMSGLTDMYRHLRSRQQGCTTGMLLCVGKRRLRMVPLLWKMGSLRRRMVEPCYG